MKVKLTDIIDALEMTDDSSEAFLNMRTGEVEGLDRCGLAKAGPKKGGVSGEPCAAELTPEKEAAIRATFIWFGLIEKRIGLIKTTG